MDSFTINSMKMNYKHLKPYQFISGMLMIPTSEVWNILKIIPDQNNTITINSLNLYTIVSCLVVPESYI